MRRPSFDGPMYSPTDRWLFQSCMKAIKISDQDVFVDMGSGKGRCVIMAACFQFRKVIGIEYNEALFHILRNNIYKIKKKNISHKIEILQQNVKDFIIDDDITVFFSMILLIIIHFTAS